VSVSRCGLLESTNLANRSIARGGYTSIFFCVLFAVALCVTGCEARYDTPQQAFMAAVLHRNVDKVRELLTNEPTIDVNWQSDTRITGPALLTAASFGPPEMVRLLLDEGADPNLDDAHGFRALYYASKGGSAEIVRMLIEAGSDLEAKENQSGHTALMVAARWKRLEVVEMLLKAGANPLAVTKNGLTAREVLGKDKDARIDALLRTYEDRWKS
jgi:ankyrin repeat protein